MGHDYNVSLAGQFGDRGNSGANKFGALFALCLRKLSLSIKMRRVKSWMMGREMFAPLMYRQPWWRLDLSLSLPFMPLLVLG